MKKIHPSGQFKKDFKKYRRYPDKVKAFKKIVDMLINEIPIPKEHKPHPLKGNYMSCIEQIQYAIINVFKWDALLISLSSKTSKRNC